MSQNLYNDQTWLGKSWLWTRAVAALRRQGEKGAQAPKRRQVATFFPGAFLIFWQKYNL